MFKLTIIEKSNQISNEKINILKELNKNYIHNILKYKIKK